MSFCIVSIISTNNKHRAKRRRNISLINILKYQDLKNYPSRLIVQSKDGLIRTFDIYFACPCADIVSKKKVEDPLKKVWHRFGTCFKAAGQKNYFIIFVYYFGKWLLVLNLSFSA